MLNLIMFSAHNLKAAAAVRNNNYYDFDNLIFYYPPLYCAKVT